MKPVLQAVDVVKEYVTGEVTVRALRGVSFSIDAGEMVGVIGPSGCGKSTLLGLIGGLDTPTHGQVLIDGTDITRMSERQLTRIRNEKIGFVFQSYNLIPTLSASENVALPVQFANRRSFNPDQRAAELLGLLGLGERLGHRPTQLSGGQQQRVAIARALANNPPLLLADEPTGNLDSEATEVVMQAFQAIKTRFKTTIIFVTHNLELAQRCDRIISMFDGQIARDERR